MDDNTWSQLDPFFREVLEDIVELHLAKRRDYATDEDPYANIRQAEKLGLPPWIGAQIRIMDKEQRIEKWICGEQLKFDSLEDDLLDRANYSLIALALWRQEDGRKREKPNDQAIDEALQIFEDRTEPKSQPVPAEDYGF